MAKMTLRLPTFDQPEVEEQMPEVPEFDRSAHFAEIGGMEGIQYLQGRNFFSAGGHFVREAPKHQWQPEETAEQKRNRIKQKAKDAKFFAKRVIAPAQVPQSIIEAELENGKARYAERLAG
jgi:hypothetical protein